MLGILKKIFKSGPAENYADLMKNGALILDVRSPGEFSTGNIKGSINIPVDSLKANLGKLKDKNRVIITCCASGRAPASPGAATPRASSTTGRWTCACSPRSSATTRRSPTGRSTNGYSATPGRRCRPKSAPCTM